MENGEEIHDRFVLTEFGGVFFGHGLGSRGNVVTRSKVNVQRMDPVVWRELRELHGDPPSGFDQCEDPVRIKGAKHV